MNLETFTQRAREALSHAAQIATTRRHPEMTPAHLVMSLVEPQDGYVAAVLDHVGAKRADVLADMEGLLKSTPRVSGAQPALSGSLAAVIEEAESLAKKRGDSHVSVELLLLATLEKGDAPLVAALGHRGLTRAAVEHAIAAVRGDSKVQSDSPESSF
jgi:ATP-dependent Clp protease ATP-binding subunit ClpB